MWKFKRWKIRMKIDMKILHQNLYENLISKCGHPQLATAPTDIRRLPSQLRISIIMDITNCQLAIIAKRHLSKAFADSTYRHHLSIAFDSNRIHTVNISSSTVDRTVAPTKLHSFIPPFFPKNV